MANSQTGFQLHHAPVQLVGERPLDRLLDHPGQGTRSERRLVPLLGEPLPGGLGQLDRAGTHLERRGSGRPVPPDPLMEAYEAVLNA